MSESRLVTKKEVGQMLYKMKGKNISEDGATYANFYQQLNALLFNCVLKGIVPFECLTIREKRTLIKILEKKEYARYVFCPRRKTIAFYPGKK